MNHTVMKEKIFALYDGELTGEARKEAEAHLKECSECGTMVEGWTAAAKTFFKEPKPMESEFFVRRVMDRIESSVKPRPAFRRNIYLRWLVPALGVAAVLFAIGQPVRRSVSIEALLLEEIPRPASWVLSHARPTADEMLEFAMEERT